jgi:hypothetical protein
MNKLFFIFTFIVSCSGEYISRPHLQNTGSIFSNRMDTIILTTKFNRWNVELMGFFHPIPVSIMYRDNTIYIFPKYRSSLPSQLLHLVLSYKNIIHVFDVEYINYDQKITKNIYQSPKTINTDSSHLQYSLFYLTSENGNILRYDTSGYYYYEQERILFPIAGSYNHDSSNPIKSFYIQPGSPVNMSIYTIYDSITNSIFITTNHLKDKYGNRISDGTLVTFHVSNGKSSRIYERFVINGYSNISLSFSSLDSLYISAKIGQVYSKVIYSKF